MRGFKKVDFNFTYYLKADKINFNQVKLDEKIFIKGKVLGNLKKILIFGIGDITNSKLDYTLKIVDDNIKDIRLKLKEAPLQKLLLLAGQPNYTDGFLTIDANIPSFDIKNLYGKAKILIDIAKVNRTLIKKDFNITLPKNTTFKIGVIRH